MRHASEGNQSHNFSEKLKPSYSSYENREKQLAACRAYYHRNKEAVKARAKLASEEVKRRKRERTKKWRAANRERVSDWNRQWLKKNPERIAKYRKQAESKPINRITHNLRRRLREFLKLCGKRTSAFFGCTGAQLKAHIEAQFTKGMSWENYGQWHVDHVVPCAAFDLTDPRHAAICFNWQNLQPLWAKDNMDKSDKNTHPQTSLPLNL